MTQTQKTPLQQASCKLFKNELRALKERAEREVEEQRKSQQKTIDNMQSTIDKLREMLADQEQQTKYPRLNSCPWYKGM